MEARKLTINPNRLTLVFQNKSDKEYTFGAAFELERKVNGKWYQLPYVHDPLFNYYICILASGKDGEWEADWQWLYGSLSAGEYRIVKDVDDFRKTGDYDIYFMAAEFSITN